jgi:hypothetical protein
MEKLIPLMCWLFKSEQHLESNRLRLKEKHQAVEVRMTFGKKTVRGERQEL